MNSRQRRNRRVFEHEVTLRCQDAEHYFEFDRRVEQARMWLQWRTKRRNYTCGPKTYISQTFKFRQAGLASIFALKWL